MQEGFNIEVILEFTDLHFFIFPSLYVQFKRKFLTVSYVYS